MIWREGSIKGLRVAFFGSNCCKIFQNIRGKKIHLQNFWKIKERKKEKNVYAFKNAFSFDRLCENLPLITVVCAHF